MPEITQILEASPPVLLVLGINAVLFMSRSIPGIRGWMRLVAAPVIGGVVYPLLSDPGSVGYAMRSPIVGQVLQGVLLGAASVYANQLWRQRLKAFGIAVGEQDKDDYDKALADSPDNPTGKSL